MADMKSKTIGELDSALELDREGRLQLAIPTQFGNLNFHILVQDIIALVDKHIVGLGAVDNTADKDKPLSDAAVLEFRKKADLFHSHNFEDIPGLLEFMGSVFRRDEQIPLDNFREFLVLIQEKAEKIHRHALGDIEGIDSALEGKADRQHTHSLSQMQGYAEFIELINRSISERATIAFVEQRIEEVNTRIGELDDTVVKELPGEW